jgi:hypothetical protein
MLFVHGKRKIARNLIFFRFCCLFKRPNCAVHAEAFSLELFLYLLLSETNLKTKLYTHSYL